MNLKLSLEDQIETDEVIELYKANSWSSAEKILWLQQEFQENLLVLEMPYLMVVWLSTIHICLYIQIIKEKGLGVP